MCDLLVHTYVTVGCVTTVVVEADDILSIYILMSWVEDVLCSSSLNNVCSRFNLNNRYIVTPSGSPVQLNDSQV